MKNISVLIPVYNEEERLSIVFEALLKTWPKSVSLKEIIFVNDGSTDMTIKIIKSKSKRIVRKLGVPVRLVSYPENRGKGYAVKQGMRAATGDYLLISDVDMSTPFAELVKFRTKVMSGSDVTVGTRKNGHSTVVVAQPIYRQLLGKGFTYLSQFILGMSVSDFTCGFKVLNRDAYKMIGRKMMVERWGYDAEILYLAQKSNLYISEIPVAWYNDKRSKVNLMKDIAQTLSDLLAIRLNHIRGIYSEGRVRDTLKVGVLPWAKEI